jgi:DNA-directed RNA polymerase specialized sigma24 family protein
MAHDFTTDATGAILTPASGSASSNAAPIAPASSNASLERLWQAFETEKLRLARQAQRIVRDELRAWDIVSDALAKCEAVADTIQEPAAYLMRTVRYEAIRWIRRERATFEPLPEHDEVDATKPVTLKDERALLDSVRRAVGLDKPAVRLLDLMLEGLSVSEACEQMGFSHATGYRWLLDIRTLLVGRGFGKLSQQTQWEHVDSVAYGSRAVQLSQGVRVLLSLLGERSEEDWREMPRGTVDATDRAADAILAGNAATAAMWLRFAARGGRIERIG